MLNSLKMNNISKRFPGVTALSDVDFTSYGGEIHALLGANGAGKSTLIKILSGAYTADSGKIYIDDDLIDIHSPKDAKQHGIHCIYQEVDTALFPELSVAENIMLEQKVSNWIHWQSMYRKAREILQSLDVSISVKKNVSELRLFGKQMVLVARALAS